MTGHKMLKTFVIILIIHRISFDFTQNLLFDCFLKSTEFFREKSIKQNLEQLPFEL